VIPVFIASSDRFADVEWMTKFSIEQNTNADVKIYIVRPQWFGMQESGCTGFTNVRYAVPQLCRLLGHEFGIYLNCDMLVIGDIAELYLHRRYGKWVCLEDGSNEVSVICSSINFPDKSVLHTRHKGTLPRGYLYPEIPLEWNCEDEIKPFMKLLHFTDLKSQPWFYDHPNAEAVALYESYRDRYWTIANTRGDQINKQIKTA